MTCPKCQTEITMSAKFCPECGNKIDAAMETEVMKELDDRKLKNVLQVRRSAQLISLAFVLAVFWLGFYVLSQSRAKVAPVKAQEEAIRKTGAWVNSLGMKFVPVPGTEVLFCVWQTRVKDYKIFYEEVARTNADWLTMTSWKNPENNGVAVTPTENCPVVEVEWTEAKAFCGWLTQKERAEGRIGEHQLYRLPDDWEWSVAVGLHEPRGGTPLSKAITGEEIYPWGTQWPPPKGAGNYGDPTLVDGYPTTLPVGSFRANKYGLYDLGGNVEEWCEDWFDEAKKERVARGASWMERGYSYPDAPDPGLQSRERNRWSEDSVNEGLGFRCVLAKDSSP